MTIVDPTQPPSGGHPTPEVRQDEDRARWERPKRPPFVMIPHDMIGDVGEHLSATAFAVAAALAEHANKAGECWPSMPTVAARLNVCRNTVVTAVAELEAAGWIERYHRRRVSNQGDAALVPDGPPSTSNLYRLLWKVTQ